MNADHFAGFIRYGMSQPLPPDASEDERRGYSDHRENQIAALAALDRRLSIAEIGSY